MKSFIINAARVVASQKKKHDVTSKLVGREWRMLTDDPSVTGKYIFLKDGKLLLSVNGLSTYSTWQMATETTLIMDEGVATFLYKVVYIDENVIVLNLDGTNNFSFLFNDTSESLSKASLEDIQVYLYQNRGLDMLSPELKKIIDDKRKQEEERKLKEEREAIEQWLDTEMTSSFPADKVVFYISLFVIVVLLIAAFIFGLSGLYPGIK